MTILRDNFFWGNSTSSMQTEGAARVDGKGPSVYDVRGQTTWTDAIDEYHRYQEDIALMANAGVNCYRFQISWSRVCPEGDGEFNEAGIQFYSDLIDALLQAGITPLACLYHFDMPEHLAEEYNGFIADEVVQAFIRFGKEMLNRFASRVPLWLTFNEQNHYSVPEVFNISGYRGPKTVAALYQIQQHVMLAHAAIANEIHANYPGLQIGGMLAYQTVYPHSPLPEDVAAARKFGEFANFNLLSLFTKGEYSSEVLAFMHREHLDAILDSTEMAVISQCRSDFISLSYYSTTTIDSTKIPVNSAPNWYLVNGKAQNPYLQETEWAWQIDPLGFRTTLNDIYNRCRLPIFPIENGIGVREDWDGNHPIEDDYRITYHREHLSALKDAVEYDGVDVMGYLVWGLIDILSSKGDMTKRYGFVYVNRSNDDLRDLKRVPKKSYSWLRQTIQSNGETL
ncbi:MAG: glycoside hydrolase family 1 protein [Lactobacillus sp.]|uniref:Glycoside hydrolase family 1 protein n=1 Tax=Lacticaseibacillus suilingensis TaxID=2799577 RepID=A0ABW4BET6_9LACO|nr:glycoside hydrolase family 1 protein [Lacticaseibacillus suilingensis]MCI1894185.1 glycoside hydrolase family 1 protein [Lactobacillus sp.]MCI1941591.1 glycoside hydrolase family 1 protein [Lactobacillus sp.]MCI1972137.1 glycoside hydrolase family 1 protein [Lactobacillus sp.]